MTDINEEIVALYFELKGYFVHKNLKYEIKKGKTKGESDIDLVVFKENPKRDEFKRAIVEVKGWHNETFSLSYFEDDRENRIYYFVRKEAIEAAEKFFKAKDFERVLVVPELSKKQRESCIREAKKRGITKILEFKEILDYIIQKTKWNKNYKDSTIQQVVRLFKLYILKEY